MTLYQLAGLDSPGLGRANRVAEMRAESPPT